MSNCECIPVRMCVDKNQAYDKYELCEFYYFRLPVLRRGFQPAQGGLLENANLLYPEAWAYLQTPEGQMLCKTEEEWQAMTRATWATLADGTTVGWNGIGGAPFYAPNLETGALRLPDLRGMYAEASGFDELGVGGVHGDATRAITGQIQSGVGSTIGGFRSRATGAFTLNSQRTYIYAQGNTSVDVYGAANFDSSNIVPVANKNTPRAWGALACVYLGMPR